MGPAAPNNDAAQEDEPANAFEAYRSEVVVEQFPRKIQSLCVWGDQVLAGLQDGSLLFFRNISGDAGSCKGAWQVVKTNRDVERKSVLQMEMAYLPIPSAMSAGTTSTGGAAASAGQGGSAGAGDASSNRRPVLLSLTEDGVNVRSLPDGMLRFQATTSKGATCFAWSGLYNGSEFWQYTSSTSTGGGLPSLRGGLLAVALKKRIQLYTVEQRERPPPAGGVAATRLFPATTLNGVGGSTSSLSDTASVAAATAKDSSATLSAPAWSGSLSLVEVARLPSPLDPVLSMAWAGTSLFLGTKKAYSLLQGETGAGASGATAAATANGHTTGIPSATEDGAAGKDAAQPAAGLVYTAAGVSIPVAAASGTPAAAAANPVSALSLLEVNQVGTAAAPCITVCPGTNEVLLARDNKVFAVGLDGQPTRRSPIVFSEPLVGLVAGEQYALGLLPSGVEIRSLRRAAQASVVQKLPGLLDARIVAAPGAAADGSVYVGLAADKGIRRLVPVPLSEQAEALAAAGEYQEALALAALVGIDVDTKEASDQQMPQGDETQEKTQDSDVRTDALPNRLELEDRLRLLYGHHLYNSGEYEEGLAQLTLVSSHFLEGLHRQGTSTGSTSPTIRSNMGHQPSPAFGSQELGRALLLLRMVPGLVPLKYKDMLPTHAGTMQLPKVLEPPSTPPAPGKPSAFSTAASVLLPYLTSYRSRLMAAAQKAGLQLSAPKCDEQGQPDSGTTQNDSSRRGGSTDGGAGGAGWTSVADSLQTEHVTDSSKQQQQQGKQSNSSGGSQADSIQACAALSLIDTAIAQAMLVQPEDTGALLRLVQQQPNWVDLEEGETMLMSYGMYAELAALYRYHGRHGQGLALLQATSQDPGSLKPPAMGAAADLPGLPGVWAAARYLTSLTAADTPLIRQHSGWILRADPEAGLQAFLQMSPPLDPATVLDILHQHSPEYCGMYLEAALEMGVALPQDYHAELLLIYLKDILSKDAASSDSEEEEEGVGTTSSTSSPAQLPGPNLGPTPAAATGAVAQAPAGSLITTPGGQAVPALQMASMPGLKPIGGTTLSTGTADGLAAPAGASAPAPPAPELPFRVGSAPFTSGPVFAAVAASEAAAGVSGRPSSSGGVGMVSSPTVGRKRLRAHRRCNSTMAWTLGPLVPAVPAQGPLPLFPDIPQHQLHRAGPAAHEPYGQTRQKQAAAQKQPKADATGTPSQQGGGEAVQTEEPVLSPGSSAGGAAESDSGSQASTATAVVSGATDGSDATTQRQPTAAGNKKSRRLAFLSGRGKTQPSSTTTSSTRRATARKTKAGQTAGSASSSGDSDEDDLATVIKQGARRAAAAAKSDAGGKAGLAAGKAGSNAADGVLGNAGATTTTDTIGVTESSSKAPAAAAEVAPGERHKVVPSSQNPTGEFVPAATQLASANARGSSEEASSKGTAAAMDAAVVSSNAADVSGQELTAKQQQGQGRSGRGRGGRRLALYQRLHALVYSSPYIDPTYVLGKLPEGELPEIRALMLERLGRHREALVLYVHDLHDLNAAEAYCDRVYESEVRKSQDASSFTTMPSILATLPPSTANALEGPSDIYMLLLEVLLVGPGTATGDAADSDSFTSPSYMDSLRSELGSQGSYTRPSVPEASGASETNAACNAENGLTGRGDSFSTPVKPGAPPSQTRLELTPAVIQQLAWLLSRKRDRLSPMRVLQALPDTLPLSLMLPWVESVLQGAHQQRRNLAVVRHLHRSDNLSAREEVARLKSARMVVAPETACCICYRRIGLSVFVAYPPPASSLAHYLCHKRQDPAAAAAAARSPPTVATVQGQAAMLQLGSYSTGAQGMAMGYE